MSGKLNDHHARVLPDTGSNFMIICSMYAKSLGLTVDASPENRQFVKQVDGTEVQTEDIVYDVDWSFQGNSASHRRNFRVLTDLHCDVV